MMRLLSPIPLKKVVGDEWHVERDDWQRLASWGCSVHDLLVLAGPLSGARLIATVYVRARTKYRAMFPVCVRFQFVG